MSVERVTEADAAFTSMTNLASANMGATMLFATDEWFATAEHMLRDAEPLFDPNTFTEFGKEMDGAETRRKRIPGHDWFIVRLARPGYIYGVDIDTAHFTGNFSPRASIQVANIPEGQEPQSLKNIRVGVMGTAAREEDFAAVAELNSEAWEELVPVTEMGAGVPATRHNLFHTEHAPGPFTHMRVNMFPDGGIARVRVYGRVCKDWSRVAPGEMVDLAAAENGGTAVVWSDAHYGHPRNLIAPGRAPTMADGWETARHKSRPAVLTLDPSTGLLNVPGSDFAVLRLAAPGTVRELELDTNHFKGNFPESAQVDACAFAGDDDELRAQPNSPAANWRPLLARAPMQAHSRLFFSLAEGTLNDVGTVTHLRLTIWPDGGISRLRAVGTVGPAGGRL